MAALALWYKGGWRDRLGTGWFHGSAAKGWYANRVRLRQKDDKSFFWLRTSCCQSIKTSRHSFWFLLTLDSVAVFIIPRAVAESRRESIDRQLDVCDGYRRVSYFIGHCSANTDVIIDAQKQQRQHVGFEGAEYSGTRGAARPMRCGFISIPTHRGDTRRGRRDLRIM